MFVPSFIFSFTIRVTSFAFFVKHYGIDPSFKFDEFAANITNTTTLHNTSRLYVHGELVACEKCKIL